MLDSNIMNNYFNFMDGIVVRKHLSFLRGCLYLMAMSDLTCPMCEMTEILKLPDHFECVTCGHEWEPASGAEPAVEERIVKDAYGNVLANGDIVAMIKDLKLKGSSQVLKVGTKSKPIRLVDGDHEIDCRMDGLAIALKACFVKKVTV
jgi:protein PhnA